MPFRGFVASESLIFCGGTWVATRGGIHCKADVLLDSVSGVQHFPASGSATASQVRQKPADETRP